MKTFQYDHYASEDIQRMIDAKLHEQFNIPYEKEDHWNDTGRLVKWYDKALHDMRDAEICIDTGRGLVDVDLEKLKANLNTHLFYKVLHHAYINKILALRN